MSFKKLFLLSILLSVFILPIACSQRHEGPIEKAGKRVDEAVDNARDGENPLKKKGAAERTGEAIDDALGNNDGR